MEWLDNDGKVIVDGGHFKVDREEGGEDWALQIDTAGNNTTLTINGVEATDRGDFALRVKNRVGEDRVNISIQVRRLPQSQFVGDSTRKGISTTAGGPRVTLQSLYRCLCDVRGRIAEIQISRAPFGCFFAPSTLW